MSEYVVSKSGVVHVRRCSAAQKATGLLPWSEETQKWGDRKCLLCFPAVLIRRHVGAHPTPTTAGEGERGEG